MSYSRLISMILSIWLVLCCPVFGEAYASFVSDSGTSARNIAYGQIEGFDYSSSAIFENPAYLRTTSFSSFYRTFPESDANFLALSYSRDYGDMTLGVGVTRHTVANNSYTGVVYDSSNNPYFYTIETFSFTENTYTIGARYRQGSLNIGFSGTLFQQDLFTSKGTGMDADFGISKSTNMFDFSLVAKRFLSKKMDYSNGYDSLDIPRQLIAAVQYKGNRGTIAAQAKMINSSLLKSFAIGYNPQQLGNFVTLQTAYRDALVLDNVKNMLTLGIELNMRGLRINVAYEKSDYTPNDNLFYVSTHLLL